MNPTNYMLVFFASLLGYLLGVGLAYIAPEELKPGKKYLFLMEKGLFLVSFLPIIYFFGKSFWVLLPLGLAAGLFFLKFKYRAYAFFGIFLIWFFLIRSNDLVVLLESAAFFLYGFPTGSLLVELSPAAVSKLKK